MAAYSLMMAGTSLMVLLAGIIGTEFAPSTDLATLPIALVVVGVAVSTLPTGKLLHRFGRRRVFIAYGFIAIAAALMAMQSLLSGSFTGFCLAAFMMGWAGAAGHQYRFAALEAVPAEQAPKATSFLLLGGIMAAFVGPELAVRGRALLGVEYAGSFLLLASATCRPAHHQLLPETRRDTVQASSTAAPFIGDIEVPGRHPGHQRGGAGLRHHELHHDGHPDQHAHARRAQPGFDQVRDPVPHRRDVPAVTGLRLAVRKLGLRGMLWTGRVITWPAWGSRP